jgi:hypothetical protein
VAGPDHDQQHCYHHDPKVKPEAATAVVELTVALIIQEKMSMNYLKNSAGTKYELPEDDTTVSKHVGAI